MATPLDRRNQLVWDALKAPGAGPKQALQLLNRRIKKGEKGDLLSVLRAYILTQLPHLPPAVGPSPSDEALSTCITVASQEPAPRDVETVKLVERTLVALGATAEVGKLHERLYKAMISMPGRTGGPDEKGGQEWFGACTRVGDYNGMQKAAMFLQTKFPKKREYYFWAITACLLLYTLETTKAQEKTMFGMLAHRMLSKAAGDVPETDEKPPLRSIQSTQELQLFFQALSKLDKDDESLKWLKSQTIGIKSKLVETDEWLFLGKYINLLESKKMWDDVVQVCFNALEGSTSSDHGSNADLKDVEGINGEANSKAAKVWQDDWKIYKSLISATMLGSKCGDKSFLQMVYNTISINAEALQPSRNALLAQVFFASKISKPTFESKEDQWPSLLEACKTYFTAMKSKDCCFDDISSYVAMLDESDSELFFNFIENSVKQTEKGPEMNEKQRINALASRTTYLKFCFKWKIEPSEVNGSSEELEAFLTECFDIYSTSLPLGKDLLITDNQYGDDALLLAVREIILKDCTNGGTSTSALSLARPIIILEYLLNTSKHNFTACLILVRLYYSLGAFSLGAIAYQRLGIKHIQKDTLSHNILTRISTLLPFPSPTAPIAQVSTNTPDVGVHTPMNPTDAAELFKIAEMIYRQSNVQTPDMINLAFENEAYGQVLDFVEFRKRLDTSITKSMYEVERRRLSKLRGTTENFTARWDKSLYINMTDNRDWETHGGGILPRTQLGPVPKSQWIKAFTFSDSITLLVTSSAQTTVDTSSSSASTSKTEIVTEPTKELQKLLDSHDGEEFTVPELKVLEATQLIGKLELELRISKSSTKAKEFITNICSYLKKETASFEENSSVESGLSKLAVTECPWQYSSDPWHKVHISYSLLETCKNMLLLHDFLLNSATAKALKPPLPKQSLVDFKQAILALGKSVQDHAKIKARTVKQISETDIDQVMVSKENACAPLRAFFQDKIGRSNVEKILDSIAISRSEAWLGVVRVKLG